MRLLKHWLYMSRATLWLVLAFARARWYFSTRALSDLQLPHPEMLTSAEKRRLQHYYYGGTYLSVIFSSLRGFTRTDEEKQRVTNMAALAYYFDDLVDSFRGRDDTGILWHDNPEEYGLAADDHRRLALHFLHNIYSSLPPAHLTAFKNTMHRVFNVETSGRQQLAVNLDDIKAVTSEKGGNSVLLFRMVHSPTPEPAEEQALLEFGCLIQYCDDIFDLWFDHQAEIATIATALADAGKIETLGAHFEQQVETTKAAFHRIQAPDYRIETALCVIHYITAITRVCIGHYLSLIQKYGALPLDNRKQMVVDMEQWGNRLRTAWWLIKG